MKIFKLISQSFLIGLAKIMPGVSGSVLAISFGLYQQGVEAISHIFKNPKKYFGFLCLTGIPIFIAMICGSTMIRFLLKYYYLPIMLLFISTIITGIKPVFLEVKEHLNNENLVFMVIIFYLFIAFMSLPIHENRVFLHPTFMTYLCIGFIDAATMVIPGISGTAILMIFGLYPVLLECLTSFTNVHLFFHNLSHLIPYVLGLAFGIYIVSKLMHYLFEHAKIKTYVMIFTLSMSSVLLLIKEILKLTYHPHEIILGIICFVLGLKLSSIFEPVT